MGLYIIIGAGLVIAIVIACHISYVAGESKGFRDCWNYIKNEHKKPKETWERRKN